MLHALFQFSAFLHGETNNSIHSLPACLRSLSRLDKVDKVNACQKLFFLFSLTDLSIFP